MLTLSRWPISLFFALFHIDWNNLFLVVVVVVVVVVVSFVDWSFFVSVGWPGRRTDCGKKAVKTRRPTCGYHPWLSRISRYFFYLLFLFRIDCLPADGLDDDRKGWRLIRVFVRNARRDRRPERRQVLSMALAKKTTSKPNRSSRHKASNEAHLRLLSTIWLFRWDTPPPLPPFFLSFFLFL